MIEKTTHRRSYAFEMWNTQIDSTRLKMMKVTAAYLGEQKNESKLKWMRGGWRARGQCKKHSFGFYFKLFAHVLLDDVVILNVIAILVK